MIPSIAEIRRVAGELALMVAFFVSTSFASSEPPTFSREIAPILQKHCQDCHRPGRIGPMSLLSFGETRPWAKAIRKAAAERTMPPWHADPSIGHWKNDRRMTEQEIETILAWVDAGSPEGDPKDLPPPVQFTEGWKNGEPDVVFTMLEEQVLGPEVEDEYRTVRIPTHLTEDKWVVASEVKPGNNAVVHHVGGSASSSKFIEYDKHAYELTAGVAGYTPGDQQVGPLPEGTGILLPTGSELVLEMHYHKEKGKEERDRTSIGFYFAKTPIRKEQRTLLVSNTEFAIPPGNPDYKVTADFTMPKDCHMTGLQPHMHYRGHSMRVTANFPDGKIEDLLYVPNYDFYWQTIYELAEPRAIPKGTKFVVEARFDNSAGNKRNPDPAATVTNGMSSTTEMMLLMMGITLDGEDLERWGWAQTLIWGGAGLIGLGLALAGCRIFFKSSSTAAKVQAS